MLILCNRNFENLQVIKFSTKMANAQFGLIICPSLGTLCIESNRNVISFRIILQARMFPMHPTTVKIDNIK